MNKQITNERGLTLVELLASIALISIISIFIFSIVTKTIENNRIIQQETILRDEADIIVSKFIKALYSTKQGYIIRNITNGNESYIQVTNDLVKCQKDEQGKLINAVACEPTLKPIGFKKENDVTKLYILDEQYSVINPNIKILSSSHIKGDPNTTTLYEVNLVLEITQSRGNNIIEKEMTFINRIQPILTSK